eukprot:TRINITY_DN7891_c0_g1_i1.p1 TRINITY_DN7891_c0_g1~~TRINITY_DN7891_c0_g1_i1.p1  ORF type:complete len:259 (+),score=23.35 TRINITY_DN7891_c0_g1_i1:63-839(+)
MMFLPHTVIMREHAPYILASAVACVTLQFISRWFFAIVLPSVYPKLDRRDQRNWDVRVVSTIHAITVVVLSIPVLSEPQLIEDEVSRALAYSSKAAFLYSLSAGYFLFDIFITILHKQGTGFVVHGVVCFFVYVFALAPFLMYYGAVFLLFEASTPFLNNHWFIDRVRSKLPGRAGMCDQFQRFNGLALLLLFFSVRVCYGLYQSIRFAVSVYYAFDRSPLLLVLFYSISNIVLNSLNLFWFKKLLVSAVQKFGRKGK